jgi:hypothetical protein
MKSRFSNHGYLRRMGTLILLIIRIYKEFDRIIMINHDYQFHQCSYPS